MCILALSLGHASSCDCDKCQPEEALTLPDFLDEFTEQQQDLADCLQSLATTDILLHEVVGQLKQLQAQMAPAGGDTVGAQYQVATPDLMVAALTGRAQGFAHSLELCSPLPGRIWKNSRFHLDLEICGGTTLDKQKFFLGAYKCIMPAQQVVTGLKTKVFLRGKTVQSNAGTRLIFPRLSFSEVSSSYPEKCIRLVIFSLDSHQIRPFVSHPIKVISRF